MESLISAIEAIIALSHKDMRNLGWIPAEVVAPDRSHPAFVDLATTRLILTHGFSRGVRLGFEIKEHLNKSHEVV